MISDSITSPSIHSATIPKDLGKKKRTNRSAKLKQSKLDARRGQWLAQVNGKGKGMANDGGEKNSGLNGENHSMGTVDTVPRKDHNNECIHHYSDSESPTNSSISCNSSLLSSENSGTNFSGSSSTGSITSGGSCSGNISEEDEADGGLDDWEAVADALALSDPVQRPSSKTQIEHGLVSPHQSPIISSLGVEQSIHVCNVTGGQAWRSDDVFRPPCLPNLSKQRTFPLKSNHQYIPGASSRTSKNVVSTPSSCPICYEDLDITDTSFIPCICGFRLCLFCHKRILEDDGRCPGCRKKYNHDIIKGEPSRNGGSVTFCLARSCSMDART